MSIEFSLSRLVIEATTVYMINTLGSGRSAGHAPSSDSHIRESNANPFKIFENPFRRNCFSRNCWKNSRCSGMQLSEATIKVGQTSECSPGEPSGIFSSTVLNRSILCADWVYLEPGIVRCKYMSNACCRRPAITSNIDEYSGFRLEL